MELADIGTPVLVELSCSVHATESEEKVLRALRNVLPAHLRESQRVTISEIRVQGYHGNPIVVIHARARGREASDIYRHIVEKLSAEDRAYIASTLKARRAGEKLYLRLDKQLAFLGVLRVNEGDDVIKVVVHFGHRSRK